MPTCACIAANIGGMPSAPFGNCSRLASHECIEVRPRECSKVYEANIFSRRATTVVARSWVLGELATNSRRGKLGRSSYNSRSSRPLLGLSEHLVLFEFFVMSMNRDECASIAAKCSLWEGIACVHQASLSLAQVLQNCFNTAPSGWCSAATVLHVLIQH
jgi:hypothetical protein